MAPEKLEQLIREGHSMFVFGKAGVDCAVNFFCSSILAGTCAIAAGVALELKRTGSQNKVWCFLGDGAEDEGHFYEAVTFVYGNALPCTFIIEDNNRSVDTTRKQRFPRTLFGLEMPYICVRRYHYNPTYPHAGSGCKHHITFK
jgi:TPP-dependent pyruvate/acetoin dehydrogenase alpha subunit